MLADPQIEKLSPADRAALLVRAARETARDDQAERLPQSPPREEKRADAPAAALPLALPPGEQQSKRRVTFLPPVPSWESAPEWDTNDFTGTRLDSDPA